MIDRNINVVTTDAYGICAVKFKDLEDKSSFAFKRGDGLVVALKHEEEYRIIFETKDWGRVFDYLLGEVYAR